METSDVYGQTHMADMEDRSKPNTVPPMTEMAVMM